MREAIAFRIGPLPRAQQRAEALHLLRRAKPFGDVRWREAAIEIRAERADGARCRDRCDVFDVRERVVDRCRALLGEELAVEVQANDAAAARDFADLCIGDVPLPATEQRARVRV